MLPKCCEELGQFTLSVNLLIRVHINKFNLFKVYTHKIWEIALQYIIKTIGILSLFICMVFFPNNIKYCINVEKQIW